MIYHELGRTGINVSKLCFGSLTMGPFQRNLTPAQGAALFECAFSHGVNFVDTAEIYGTYPHLREAVRLKPDLVVCSKSYAYDRAGAEASLRKADEMLAKIRAAHAQGQGIIAMKPLGGGHLIAEREAALDYILNLDDCIDTIAIGMQSVNEVEYNCRRFSGEKPDEKLSAELAKVRRTLLIQEWCEGCGTCVAACHNHALRIENGRAVVDQSKCALCGYCARACPQFTIKVI